MGVTQDAELAAFEEKHAAWLKKHGVEPATGDRAELLEELAKTVEQLKRVIKGEQSGFRAGYGVWAGSEPLTRLFRDIARLEQEWLAASKQEKR